MGDVWTRFTMIDKCRGTVKRIRICEDIRAEVVLVSAEPTGPDSVFVIQYEPGATQHDVELMMKALCDERIPYIQQHF